MVKTASTHVILVNLTQAVKSTYSQITITLG